MYRFRKKSETKRPQVIEDGVDLLIPPPSSTSSTFDRSPTLPALSTGLEFRTSVIFPDLTRQFAKAGRAANVPESKLRSRLAQQRAQGNKEETITEEEEAVMFAALSSIQGIRRRGNSTSSAVDTPVDTQYPESVSSSNPSGPSSAGLINSFPETPAVQETSIYPFASLSSHSSSSSSSRRHSNNLFGASRFRDIGQLRSGHRNRSSSSASTSQESMQAVAISPDSSQAGDLRDVQEEVTSSSSSSPVVENGSHQLSDKDKTPTARVSHLPAAPRLPNGNTLTVAQIRRMSVALERAMSAFIESDPDADEDEEKILAPYSVPLGGGYPNRRPPTAFNDPNHPIPVSDLNAVLAFLADSERARDSHVENDPHRIPTPVAPVPVTRTPGYVPGMARPISPRDASGHDSEDYSTTPRATSPVSPYGRVHRGLVPQSKKQANSRPSTAPTLVANANAGPGSNWGTHDESTVAALERSLSAGGQLYERRMQGNGQTHYGSSSISVLQNGRTLTSGGSSIVSASTQRPATAQNGVHDYANDGFSRHTGIQGSYNQNQDPNLARGIQRDKPNLRSMTGPALPDSPTIHDDVFQSYAPLTAPESWNANQKYTTPQANAASSGIVMPQPTTHRQIRTPASVPVRSQTPNNLARSSTPVGTRATSPPIARVGTPNYLVQRSPSANGFNLDQETQDITARRAISPRPTSSHTPSNSSTSAYNPLLHNSMGSSSRSSIGSVGSSYHSSDEEPNSKFKEVTNWLFDPESKGSTFVSAKQTGRSREELASSKEFSDVKDDASESIDDQEDVLQLLTGLTKKDIGTIQQKLISAAAAREAEEAIRTSQRRRRPSVQSREFVGSPTPKPVASPTDTTAVSSNHVETVTIVRLQSPPPGPIPEEQHSQPVETISQPPMIVARPMSPVEEVISEVKIPGEFEVPSAATTPPRVETPPQAKQSPRTKALTDALFGGNQLGPAASGPRQQPSVEELQFEVEKRAFAATVALKNPVVVADTSPLRRKSTKRIDLQKISGPHLVSASMSVDAIPLASQSMASLSQTPQDGGRTGSKLGDRLRRLRGSIKTKTQQGPGHDREPSSSSLAHEITPNGPSQVLDYDPQALSTPQIRTVPPTTPNKPLSAGPTSPPASAGPAGLRGLVARFRQSKGNPRKEENTPPRSAVSVQPSASSSSSHLNDTDASMTMGNMVVPPSRNTSLNRAQPTIASSPSDVTSISSTTAQTPDEAALRKRLLDTALTLGLNVEDINVLLEKAATQGSKGAAHSDSPSDSSQRTTDEGQWAVGQASTSLSRQTSTRVRIEAGTRLRPMREGGNPISGVVRRTIIYPSSSATPSASPLPGHRGGVQRKMSSASNKRRPMSVQSQYSGKSIHERVPTPPPPRGARRISEDGLPPMPSSLHSSNARPGTSAGIIYDGISNSHRRSIDGHDGGPDTGFPEDGRALQVVELENGEVIWSVLDTLRSPGDEFDDESRSIYFNRRGSLSSQYSGMDERSTYGRSTSRIGMPRPSFEGAGPETKIYYGDNKEIARLIGQITNATEYGSQMGHLTPGSAYSSEDLPVEEQLERLLQRVTAAQ